MAFDEPAFVSEIARIRAAADTQAAVLASAAADANPLMKTNGRRQLKAGDMKLSQLAHRRASGLKSATV